jgi:hypothetical protein
MKELFRDVVHIVQQDDKTNSEGFITNKNQRVMTLDQAIKHALDKAYGSICATEHKQLANWLINYKKLLQEKKDLVKWAKAQSKSLKTASQKPHNRAMHTIYYGRSEWIDFELLPKLGEF